MSEHEEVAATNEDPNGSMDVIAAVAIIVIPVITIVFWLSGMPT